MPRLRDSPDDFVALVGATSEATRMPEAFVEKDYWATELLRSIAHPVEHTVPIFKGGTSLTKVFRVIHRFSEDVDILIQIIPADGRRFGESRRDSILKTYSDRVLKDLGLDAKQRRAIHADRGNHRSYAYECPLLKPSAAIRPGVILEIGVRGEPSPRARHPIRSYMAEHALKRAGAAETDFEEFASFESEVLSPERTLVEKLAMLHDVASRYPESAGRVEAAARHLYDISALLSNSGIRDALRPAPETVIALAQSTDRVSQENNWSFTARPADGYGASPAFELSSPVHETLRQAYERIVATLVFGDAPTYTDCLRRIREHNDLL